MGDFGLKFVSTGLGIKRIMLTTQPQLSATLIACGSGVRMMEFGLVFPQDSKTKAVNDQRLRSLINGDDALPETIKVWHSEYGGATDQIMGMYLREIFPTFPDLPLFHSFDAVRLNYCTITITVMDKMNVHNRIVPAYLTPKTAGKCGF